MKNAGELAKALRTAKDKYALATAVTEAADLLDRIAKAQRYEFDDLRMKADNQHSEWIRVSDLEGEQ